jgi:stage II sporulation protein Q
MNENKGKESRQTTPKTIIGAEVVQTSGWKRWLAKKWAFPAMYMAAAAIILALMWVIQDSGKTSLDANDLAIDTEAQNESVTSEGDNLNDALPVNTQAEAMQWPVQDRDQVEVIMPFFEADASNDQKQAAIIEQEDTLIPSMGIALSRQDNQTFDVLAAMSGEVTRTDKVPSVGNLVELTHDNGLVTVYYSLAETAVTKGEEVKQGDVIAKAGRNEMEKNLGVHVHFEVISDGEPVNPETFIASNTQ